MSDLSAQSPALTVNLSTNKPAQHSVFEIQFELKDGSGSEFRAPSFEGFRVVGGPAVSSSTMIINGKMSRSQSWSYSLLAPSQGKFTIEPASVVVNRKKISSKPVTIDVKEPISTSSQGYSSQAGASIILRAEVDEGSYYPGQQIILRYRLLFTEPVQTIHTLSEDDYSDFFVQNFSDFDQSYTYENINGVQYTARVIKSLALYAHQSGEFTIDPFVATVGVQAPTSGNQSFFSMRRLVDVQVASQTVKLKIQPLPSNAPGEFSGAVGQYQIKTIPGPSQITTNDAYSFRLELTGNGDGRRWDPPVPSGSSLTDRYDPKIIDEKIRDIGQQVEHIRIIEYQIVPKSPGNFEVFVPFTYFDPVEKRFLTISSDTLHVQVLQGHSISGGINPDSASESKLPLKDVRYPLFRDRFWTSFPHLLLFGLLVSGSLFGFITLYRKNKERHIPLAEKIKFLSGQRALSELAKLEANSKTISPREMGEKIASVFYRFLEERYGIPPSDLDEAKVENYLTKAEIPDQEKNRSLQLFRQCLVARYAPMQDEHATKSLFQEAKDLILRLAA